MKRLPLVLAVAFALAACGCAMLKPQPKLAPGAYPGPLPQLPPTEASGHVSEGSLYAEGTASELVGDFRARHVGDVLIIKVSESAVGSTTADSAIDKASASKLKAPTPLGYAGKLAGQIGSDFDPANAYDVSNSQTFSGKGSTTRQNTLNARIAVRVMAVGQNGLLLVAGTKQVAVNQERQNLTLAGIVRPEDVASDNTIPSSAVSDLVINYGGKGDLNDVTKQGWFTKLLHKIWPF